MKKSRQVYWLFVMLIFIASCKGQNPRDQPKRNINQTTGELPHISTDSQIEILSVDHAPNTITRTIIQDKIGNIWFATFGGVFKYDGDSFKNTTEQVSSSRFFSSLEDRTGNLWFGSIGSGVFQYDGESFQNFTTNEGLASNEIVCIYEDKSGKIWFGANGGFSVYDGKYFRNFMMKGDSILEVEAGEYSPNLQRPINEVNTIVEDKSGNFWLGTRGNTFIFDGNTFNIITQNGRPFMNVRSIIEDRSGHIWLGGNDGLWKYDSKVFTNITKNFVGYIYEDKQENIWTSSGSPHAWVLSRYSIDSSDNEIKMVSEIKKGEGMIFGIVEDANGNIWFGTLQGVYRYDGNTIIHYKDKVN